jgi:monolysocardiolipin acyltransferase
MAEDPRPPSLPWRIGSAALVGFTGTLARIFMNVPNSQKAHGLAPFLQLIDKRADPEGRQRGLLTGKGSPSVRSIRCILTECY